MALRIEEFKGTTHQNPNRSLPPLYIPDPKLPKSDQKQTKFHSKSDLNQTNLDLFPDQIQEKQT